MLDPQVHLHVAIVVFIDTHLSPGCGNCGTRRQGVLLGRLGYCTNQKQRQNHIELSHGSSNSDFHRSSLNLNGRAVPRPRLYKTDHSVVKSEEISAVALRILLSGWWTGRKVGGEVQ